MYTYKEVRGVQAVEKGGIADSKDSDKHQISLRTVKKPKPTCWFIQWEKRPIASFIHLDWATTTERSITQYQTSPKLTLLSKETLSMNEEVQYAYRHEEGEPVDSFRELNLPASRILQLWYTMKWSAILDCCGLTRFKSIRDYKLIQN